MYFSIQRPNHFVRHGAFHYQPADRPQQPKFGFFPEIQIVHQVAPFASGGVEPSRVTWKRMNNLALPITYVYCSLTGEYGHALTISSIVTSIHL